jgi:uncharacterized protein (TIGR00296 family)
MNLWMDYSVEDGIWLVRVAREAVEHILSTGTRIQMPQGTPEKMLERLGVFVTIRTYPAGQLRGCIGRPEPSKPLIEGLIDSAIDSALHDPRFSPLTRDELHSCTFEVSILSSPKKLQVRNPLEYRRLVEIGRDGLIAEWEGGAGLLLPQVPVEEGWDVDTYLSYICMKAGAHPDYWLLDKMKLYTFQAVVFGEVTPLGEVREKLIGS